MFFCVTGGVTKVRESDADHNVCLECIGRFSEAGLHVWMPFVIFRTRSRERSQLPLSPGRFLSRRWFTLCITVEVEPTVAKLYKCPYCCLCKNYRVKVMKDGKKVSLQVGWPEDRECVEENAFFSRPIARATSYCLLPDTFWIQAFKNALKVGTVNFANSLTPPFILKKVPTGSKSGQGT